MNKTKKFLVLLKLTVRWSETVNGKYNLEIIKYVLNKDIFFWKYTYSQTDCITSGLRPRKPLVRREHLGRQFSGASSGGSGGGRLGVASLAWGTCGAALPWEFSRYPEAWFCG